MSDSLVIDHASYPYAEQVVELGRAMAAESPRWRDVPYDAERLLAFTRTMSVGASSTLAVALEGETVIGFVLAVVADDWFTGRRYVSPLVIYVRPDRRKGRVGRALIEALEAWGLIVGADEIYMGLHTGGNEAGFSALGARLGYVHAGVTLHKRL